jgi:hypothetical protein
MKIVNPVLAAGYVFALTIAGANAQTDPRNEWHAVQVKCPAANGGVLETLKQRELGEAHTQVIQVRYQNGSAINFKIQNPGSSSPTISVNLLTEDDPNARNFANLFLDRAEKDLRHFCLSEGEERIAADKEIAENRRKFGIE